MNKLIFKNFIPLIFSILLMFFISFVWKEISIPLNKTQEIIGNYSKNNHHQFNDTLRYLFIILIPLFSYIITYTAINNKTKSLSDVIFENSIEKNYYEKYKEKYFYLFIFILVILFDFITIDLPDYKLDIFHEGQLLTGALNFSIKGKLWTGSYLNTGLFYDILNTKTAWFIFGNETIGSYRIYQTILNYIFIIFTILLAFSVSKIFKFEKRKEIFFFISLSLFFLFFYGFNYSYFPNYRDIFSVIFLLCLINAFFKNNFQLLNYFIIGNLSIISLLWSLDRGIFLNATMLFLIFVLIFKKKYQEIFFILLGLFFSWIIFFFIVGSEEFNAFLNNSVNIINYNELWNGIVHPQPFSDEKNSSRATKALILILLNGIIISNYFFNKSNSLTINTKLFLLIFYILGFFYYKVGLSRSDGGHIAIGASINNILFAIILIYSFLRLKINYVSLDMLFTKKILIFYFILSVLIIFTLNDTKKNNIINFLTFKSRINKFINQNDNFFIKKNYSNFINKIKLLTKDHDCLQNINYDPTIYYLLKKQSCTKYYYTFIMASKSDQKKFIEELKLTKPKIIIYGNNEELKYEFNHRIRFPIIERYLNNNYKEAYILENYKIYN